MGSLWGPGVPSGLLQAPSCGETWNYSPGTAGLVERGLLAVPGRDL